MQEIFFNVPHSQGRNQGGGGLRAEASLLGRSKLRKKISTFNF